MSNDWTAWEDLYGGVLVGSLPTVSMLLTSLLTFNAKISSTFESTAQNFCAGLIIGAVAKELFPQIDTDNKYDNLVGISVGFFIGIIFVNFLDYLVDFIQHNCSCCGFEGDGDSDSADNSINGSDVENSGLQLQYQSIGSRELVEDSGSESGSEADQSEPIIMLASQAIASPMHRYVCC